LNQRWHHRFERVPGGERWVYGISSIPVEVHLANESIRVFTRQRFRRSLTTLGTSARARRRDAPLPKARRSQRK
jgi:hypothetical protein